MVLWDGLSENTRQSCERLFALAGQRAFVLCRRAQDGPAEPEAAADLKGALAQLKERFGSHVAGTPVVFVASGGVVPASLKAIRGEPSFFSRVVLVADDRIPWSATLASVFVKGGGERVLFACRSEPCETHTTHPIRWLQRHGGKARLAERAQASADANLPFGSGDWQWLVAGDTRFVGTNRP